ncbi:MAG: hypothetical protein HKN47_05475 [Pirellulaceae bacterium]|nr:hypothetical protein [Pirellulaceae bacterium]
MTESKRSRSDHSSTASINPYQPPDTLSELVDVPPVESIVFQLTERNLNHGQSHHLIRCRPYPVVVVSLVMIAVSLVVFSYAVMFFGPVWALLIMPVLLAISALSYGAVIREPKRKTQQRMRECSLVAGAVVTIQVEPDEWIVRADDVTLRWQREQIKHYQTPRGLMIVPEKYVFLFLPRRGQFDRATYRSIVNLFPKK